MKKYEILFGVMTTIILNVEAEDDENARKEGWDVLCELSDDDMVNILADTYQSGNIDFDIIQVEEDEYDIIIVEEGE